MRITDLIEAVEKSNMEEEAKAEIIDILKDTDEFKLTNLAAEVIDLVEWRIRELFPDIDLMAEQLEGNTLLHGEKYYELEDEIIDKLKELKELISK